MNRKALILSAVLTAFVLSILGGIGYSVRAAQGPQPQAAQTNDIPVQGQLSQAQLEQLQQTFQEREAAYQKMIAEANARLEKAQQDQLALQVQVSGLQGSATASEQTQVSPEQAAQIAGGLLNQTSVYSVESGAINGSLAYKVTFSSGDVAYVSAQGQVLGIELASTVNNSGGLLASGGEHEGEREDHDD